MHGGPSKEQYTLIVREGMPFGGRVARKSAEQQFAVIFLRFSTGAKCNRGRV